MLLLFDIGGSQMRFSFSNGVALGDVMILPTPRTYKDALDTFRGVMAAAPAGAKITRAVGGVPFLARRRLTYWWTNPAEQDLERIVGAPVRIRNDAELAAIGEASLGAGKGHRVVGYLTFSTGFGGAKVIDRRVDPNHFGFEPRMQIADMENGRFPEISGKVSGRGLKNEFGKDAKELTRKTIWRGVERWICVAVNNAAAFWSPEVIILGGAMMNNREISVPRVQQFINRRFRNFPRRPRVVKAKLGQLNGLYGALVSAEE